MKKSTLLTLLFVLVNLGLDAQTPCPNSVINGDFEAGNTGFTSGLTYNCDCVDATVCVNANFGQKCRGWATLGNHTPGGTNYLIVDGSSTGPVNVWATTVPVSPGDTYTFSFWVATAYVSRDLIFDLGMIVNGQTVRQFTVSQATPTWTQYSFTGICPVGLRSMPIAIRQLTGGNFRDFGIDDIYFACCDCKADYTTTELDGCGRIQFNNTSIVPGGVSYSWDFGDTASGMNNTSTEPNPIHQFSKCGTYNVCLTLKGEGCSSKICYTVDASDKTIPFIICPRNQTVNTNPGQCYFTGTLPQPSSSDNCDESPEIVCSLITPTSSILITPQTQFPKGENTIVCFARDKCGNVSRSCSYILTVRDNQAPKITCPPSLSLTVEACPVIVRNLQPLSFSDNCGTPSVSFVISGATSNFGVNDASGLAFNAGVSTVTYTATDLCGNQSSCSFEVNIKCEGRIPQSLCGQSVLTCFSGFNITNVKGSGLKPNGNVLAMVDIRALTNTGGSGFDAGSTTPMNKNPQWVYSRMGQVFGLAIDANDYIYAAASTIYGKFFVGPNNVTFGSAGAGGIYKINPITGVVTDFVKTDAVNPNTVGTNFIYNTGSGLGNICYDRTNNQFFATNFTDGKIYRISAAGIVLSTYDHPGSSTFPPTDATYVALGDRPYGIQINPSNGRLYYTVWREDLGRKSSTASNEVWSIALSGGNFSGVATCEVQIPPYLPTTSCAPSDLAFSQSGKMLIGERTSSRDWPISVGSPAHQARVLEYSGLPPFTGGCNAAVWGTAKVIYVGNFDVNNNCSGGVDYGYGGFDFIQNKPLDCDELIWSTGDALKFGTTYNFFPGDSEVVYGLAGMPASGNTNTPGPTFVKTSSYYIDMGAPGKTEFGDVEIFKCACTNNPTNFPCDSISVTKSDVNKDACCFSVDFKVKAGPVAYVEAEILTPGVTFNNVSLNGSLAYAGLPTATLIPIKHNPFHFIPQTNYPNAMQFCLGNITNATQVPQVVVFRWYVTGPDDRPYLACTDTCTYECTPPVVGDTCVAVLMDSVTCDPQNPNEFCVYLKVKNLSTNFGVIANQLILSGATPGFSFKPCPPPTISATAPWIGLPLLTGLSSGQSSGLLCVKLVANAPVLSATKVCFNLGLSGSNDCCNSSIPYCVTLEPCCNPCENRSVTVRSPQADSCCRSLDIRNECKINYFTKLELQLLTPGVIFGSHFTGGPNPSNWSNPVSTNTEIEWTHTSGYIPNGNIAGLINFCIDGIDQPSEVPQKVVLNWIINGANGRDSVACSDTLIFECKQTNFPCIKVLEDRIICKQDAQGNIYYQYTLTFQNSAAPPHVATELVFSQIGPPPVTVFPNPVSFPPLPPNGTTTITTNIFGTGLKPGDKQTFEVRLHDALNPDNWCCFEADTVCIFIPECDSCCADSLTFAALVNQGFTVVNQGCSVTVTAPQFDSCYSFTTPPVLDGGIAPQVITDPSGSWTFNFTQSGVHQICVTVFDECQSKQMCTTVRVDCDRCECGTLDWATFSQINGGFSKPIRCGGNNLPTLPVPCPKPGLDYLIHGNYRCIPDACGTDTVRWVLDRPGALPDVPGLSYSTYPHFDASIPWNLCTTPGTYVLHISRNCGGKECPCSFKFEVPPCPCTCDQLSADITAGFKTVGIQPFNTCKRSFMPYALCPDDMVTWRINGSIVPGNTTGNAIKMITFKGPGIYQVYMTVIRTNPNGTKCGGEIWQNVKVNCDPGGIDPKISFCENDVIQNGDFTEGVEAGHLAGGPRKPWTPVIPADGRGFLFEVDSSGSSDAGHLILNGGKGSFAAVWQEVNLIPNLFTTIEFDYRNYLGKSSPAGTVLEFRLEPDSISGGPSQILYRHPISDTSAAWTNVVVSVKASPNPDFKYLFICVQNDDDELQSAVGIDNLSMCTNSISDTKQLSALKPIRIFPNPNPGSFNVELPQPAATGMALRVTDLAGRLVLEKPTQTGNKLQTVQAENLPGGMYLLQVVEKGRVVGVEKFVKQ